MPHDRRIVLSIADEHARLPEVRDVSSLYAQHRSARTTLLARSYKRADEWYEGCVKGAAGPAPPLEWHRYHDIYCAPVVLCRQLDAHYSPGTGAIITNDGAALSASVAEVKYLTQDLSGLPGASAKDDSVVLTLPADEKRLEKVIVTMPWGGIDNYGHFVLDCLPAVALLATVEQLAEYKFAFPPLQPWHLRHLELLGIEPLQCADDWYFADEIVYTNCMDSFLHWPNVNYRMLVAAQMRRIEPIPESARSLYVARRGNNKRAFISEETFCSRLTELGVETICPEELSIDQQIESFRSASVIIGCSGAGLANAIYCRPGTPIIEMLPSLLPGIWVRNICAMMGLRWRPYFCESSPAPIPLITIGGVERPEIGITLDADLDDFLSFLKTVQH